MVDVPARENIDYGSGSTVIGGIADDEDDVNNDDNDKKDEDLTTYFADVPTKPEESKLSQTSKRKARASKYDEIDARMAEFLHADHLPVGHPAKNCQHQVWNHAYRNNNLHE